MDSGDAESSFAESALQYLDALYGYAMTLTHDPVESEELVQETYVRAVRASGRLQPGSNLKSWMFTILRNARFNELRRTKNGPISFDLDENQSTVLQQTSDTSAKDPYVRYLDRSKEADVRNAVEGLPAAYREVIVLREFEDLSYGEIAQVLNCPPGTVMSRLARAREKLKQALQHWDPSVTTMAGGA